MKWIKDYKIGILLFISLAINICYLVKINSINDLVNKNKGTLAQISAANNTHLKHVYTGIFESNFKDDLVLNSFNNSITIVISFFTALITLAALFSFKKINEDINHLKDETTKIEFAVNEVNKAKANIKDIEDNFINAITNQLQAQISLSNLIIINFCAEKKDKQSEHHVLINEILSCFYNINIFNDIIFDTNTDDESILNKFESSKLMTTISMEKLYTFLKDNINHTSDLNKENIRLALEVLAKQKSIVRYPKILDEIKKIINLYT